MSIPSITNITCGFCGNSFSFWDWESTNSIGSVDLDSRPAGDYRNTINQLFVKKCNNCGYCNYDIETCPDNLKDILNSDIYIKQLNNKLFPEKANEFLCKSIILETNQDIENAAWSSLHAAWNCDDKNQFIQSKYCRNKAVKLFTLANISSSISFKKKGEFSTLMVDLYRRTENFDYAEKICNARLNIEDDELLKKIFVYQKYLIQIQDVNAYKIDDAILHYENNISKLDDDFEEFDM